ncbi:hypothetical protein HYS91_03395 [Candidatus Daviesbacteria bacterium]|nr:hypothetical protein [Candidatus Daviesbacteria bacterium]
MTKEEVKEFLIKLFPGFSEVWNSEDNYQKEEDGSYTYHGLFIEFSPFFIDNINNFSDEQLKELFSSIEKWEVQETATFEEWRSGKVDEAQLLSNAIFTCFLENIAGEGFTERIQLFMGKRSFEYYSHYDH